MLFFGAIFLIGFIFIASWNYWHFNYWKRRSIPHIPSAPFVGNVLDALTYRYCFGDQFRHLHHNPKAKGNPFIGIHVLHNHAILLRDPELIKQVLVKDFKHFSSRFETTDPVGDSMGSLNLFFAKYEIWREIHLLFTPLFSYGKIKQMYPLMQEIGFNLEKYIEKLGFDSETNSTVIEVKEMCALFTTDLIASLAFGIEAKSLQNGMGEFRQMCIEVNDPRPKRILHFFTLFFVPQLSHKVGTHLYSSEYESFMRKAINHIVEERENSGLRRNDLIDIFIALKHKEKGNIESIVKRPDFFVAQAAFLLLAGFDTSSSTITFALYELAKNPSIQARLRKELQEALIQNNGCLTYDSIHEMEYLRMVVDEVLRLYPPTSFLDRCCNAEDGYKLKSFIEFTIPKSMPVYISVLGLHRDETLWPNPNKFDPERFSPENRQNHVAMSYLPFGGGPRSCIGIILGQMQVKIGLVHILKNYMVKPCEKTQHEIKFDPKAFVLAPKGGTFLSFVNDKLY